MKKEKQDAESGKSKVACDNDANGGLDPARNMEGGPEGEVGRGARVNQRDKKKNQKPVVENQGRVGEGGAAPDTFIDFKGHAGRETRVTDGDKL